jgi:CubicO group peptidase (beta-lactamase class C family)
VGKLIEKISGENLETYFRINITGPLKMNSTYFNVPENLKENIVS